MRTCNGVSANRVFQSLGVRSATSLAGWMQAGALQHVHQVGVRIQVVQFARGDQALDDPNMFGPAEQLVLLCHKLILLQCDDDTTHLMVKVYATSHAP